MTKFYTDEKQIINWLEKYKIKKYTLVPDKKYEFIVNVNGHVDLRGKELLSIPVKFNEVNGDFYCNDNKLTSLEFSPQTVDGDFYCSNNKLTSLEFIPQTVGLSFDCSHNLKLKEIQQITDFKLIYLEHKKILINKLSDKLSNNLINKNPRKITKIKI